MTHPTSTVQRCIPPASRRSGTPAGPPYPPAATACTRRLSPRNLSASTTRSRSRRCRAFCLPGPVAVPRRLCTRGGLGRGVRLYPGRYPNRPLRRLGGTRTSGRHPRVRAAPITRLLHTVLAQRPSFVRARQRATPNSVDEDIHGYMERLTHDRVQTLAIPAPPTTHRLKKLARGLTPRPATPDGAADRDVDEAPNLGQFPVCRSAADEGAAA